MQFPEVVILIDKRGVCQGVLVNGERLLVEAVTLSSEGGDGAGTVTMRMRCHPGMNTHVRFVEDDL